MSYILNALKQSENQRSRGEIPHVDTAQDLWAPSRPVLRRVPWPWLVGGLALLLALAYGWQRLRTPEAAPEAAARPLELPGSSAPPAAAPAAREAQAASALGQLQDMAGTRVQLDERKPAPVVLELPQAAGRVAPPAPHVAAAPPAVAAPAIPARTEVDEGAPEVPLAGVGHWKSLPAAVQRQLREVGINAHVYSADAAARFVRAKGRSLREGDRLGDELQLQQITRDGIIFTYRDGKYWMRLN